MFRVLVLVLAAVTLGLLAGPHSADAQQTASASRSFSSSTVEAGDELVVTIAVSNYGGIGQLIETFPDGFTFVESSPSVTPSGRTLTFNLVGDASVSYTLTAPTSTGTKPGFSGTLRPATGAAVSVGGPSLTVLDGDETLTLWSDLPGVGIRLSSTLADPNGPVSGVTWQWKRSSDDRTYTDIPGATSASYTPVAGDVGYYLRVTVTYTDALGAQKSATATTPNAVAADDPLVALYDANNNGEIEKREVIAAINDYLFDDSSGLTKADVIRLINLYLFPDE